MRDTELVNAKLLRVGGGGDTDTFDGPAGAAPAKWEGDVGVWLEERRSRRSTGDGASDIVVRRELTVSAQLPIAWADGDTVTLQRTTDQQPIIGTVGTLEGPTPPRGEQGELHLSFEPS